MPTDTKKIAPNKSFTGFTKCSIRSASMVSAKIEPMTKAPRADENPAFVAIITIPRHSPMLTINRVSSFRKLFAFFRKEGIKQIPTTKQNKRKMPNLTTLSSISMPSTCLLTATVESNTINNTANRSSTTKIPNTTPANRWLRNPMSSNALKIIVVEDIDNIPPRKRLFICPQPSDNPVI